MEPEQRQMIISVQPTDGTHGNSKFTPHRQQIIVEAIRRGASIRLAATAASIGENCLRRWIREGDADIEEDKENTERAKFAIAVHLAEWDCAQQHLRNIEVNSIADWRASAWLLERRYASDYGKMVMELQGNPDQPITVRNERMTDIFAQMAEYERQQLSEDVGVVQPGTD